MLRMGFLTIYYGAPKDHVNTRILQHMISGTLLILDLGTSMLDPYVYVVCWAPDIVHGIGYVIYCIYIEI